MEAAVLDAPPTNQPAAPEPPDMGSRMASFAEKNPVSRTVEKPEPKAPEKPAAIAQPKEAPKETPKVETPKEAPKEVPKEEAPKTEQPKPVEAKPGEAKAPEVPKPRLGEMFRNERTAHEATRAERDALKKEVETLRSQKPEFDPTQHPEFIKHKTRAEELENEIRFVNYEKSAEFQEKYNKPYVQAWNDNAKRALDLKVKIFEDDPVTGERVPKGERGVTKEEFWNLVNAPSDDAAIDMADRLFPNSASKSALIQKLAEDTRTKGRELTRAVEEARTKGAEREKQAMTQKQQQEQMTRKQQEERAEKWSQIAESDRMDARVKDLFNAADDDAKGKEILTKGQKAARLAFGMLEGDDKPLEGDAEIAAHAEVYNKAAAFNYNVYKRRQAEAMVEELTKKLAEYENSVPGAGAPKGAEAPPAEDADARMLRFATGA